jgi:hypothetical protein
MVKCIYKGGYDYIKIIPQTLIQAKLPAGTDKTSCAKKFKISFFY